MENLKCNSKAQALLILEVIAESLGKGTTGEALKAVASWIKGGGGMELKVITEAEAEALNN